MKRVYVLLTIMHVALPLLGAWHNEKKQYNLTSDPIDVVIACHEKDRDILQYCVRYARENIKNVRRIIVVSEERFTNSAEWFDESLLPFSKKLIAQEFERIDPRFKGDQAKRNRVGWYFKQILNFYVAFVIPGISDNILILDGDTLFLKPVDFVDDQGNMLHVPGTENHRAYFEHMSRFLPGLIRAIPKYSGISHHMLFQRPVLKDLFDLVESHHKMEFWRAYVRCIDPKDIAYSGSADYEIYFNFMVQRSNQIIIRDLKWQNVTRLSMLNNYKREGYDFVSIHHYSRQD